jgi:phospholipase A1
MRSHLVLIATLAMLGVSAATAQAVATASATPVRAEVGRELAPPVDVDACHRRGQSELSRFWELQTGSDCGTFRIRGFRPLTLSLVGSDSVNKQPSSSAALHTASTAIDYSTTEMRMQLSVRTKLASGLLPVGPADGKDSLWFAYSQQSYWQIFSADISRPFRATDHEPELIYVYPTEAKLPWGGRLRYTGAGVVHQSNGQSLPLSRSWNRVYLMTGAEWDTQWIAQAKLWRRIDRTAAEDDNPGIENYVGRSEFKLSWNINNQHTLSTTLRHSLRPEANGSLHLEWLRTLGQGHGDKSNLRLHTEIFSGYGDTLVDFNRRRHVFRVGLSLLDF